MVATSRVTGPRARSMAGLLMPAPARRRRVLLVALALLIAVLVCAPMMQRGWLLLLDSVPGPRGVGPWEPPAGPIAYGVSWAVWWLFGAAAGWLPLALVIVVAALGAGAVIDGPFPAQAVSAVAYAANPFVWDRVYAGQIQVLIGYALLPWLLRGLVGLAEHPRRWPFVAGVWALASAATLHLFWIGLVLVLAWVVVATRGLGARRAWTVVGAMTVVAAAVSAAWALPARGRAFEPGGLGALAAFATRPVRGLGLSLGILAQGGFWRVPEDPAGTLGGLLPWLAVLAAAAACFGLLAAQPRHHRLGLIAAIAGFAGWFLAHGGQGPVGPLYRALYRHVPTFAVMREAGKFTMLVSLAVAVGLGLLVADAGTRIPSRAFTGAGVAALVIALGATCAWGLWGRLSPSRVPRAWATVHSTVARCGGRAIALPWTLYLDPGFTDGRGIRNPAPTWIDPAVLTSRDPEAPFVPGDSGRRAVIGQIVRDEQQQVAHGHRSQLGERLGKLGVRWVVTLDAQGLGGGLLHTPDSGLEIVERDRSITLARVRTADPPGRSSSCR